MPVSRASSRSRARAAMAAQFAIAPAGTGRMPSFSSRRLRAGFRSCAIAPRGAAHPAATGAPVPRRSRQRVDERLELVLKLGEHVPEHALGAVKRRLCERAVGATAHGDVIVDVHRAAREAAGEESGDEQGDVAEALERTEALPVVGRIRRFGEQQRERLELRAVGIRLEERVRMREHREQVDDVMLGVVADVQVLVLERGLHRLAEELAHVSDGLELHGVSSDGSAGRFCKLRRSLQWQSTPSSAEAAEPRGDRHF